jgi:sec-independent protein translocase protein TatB
MPSFLDSGFIVLLALLLFGPKRLPLLARQAGKLMADFRRASNEFRTQMEEEFRISEQAERQKKIEAIEAAAPATPSIPEPQHPHLPPEPSLETASEQATEPTAPLPIATSGELNIMPPATGLPVPNTSLSPFVDSIPEVSPPETPSNGVSHTEASATEVPHQANGAIHESASETETRPWMI